MDPNWAIEIDYPEGVLEFWTLMQQGRYNFQLHGVLGT